MAADQPGGSAEMPEREGEPVVLPVRWIDGGGLPIIYADNFALQLGSEPDSYLLSFGQLDPPLVLGEPGSRQEQLREISYVPVHIVSKYALSLNRLQQLARLLVDHLKQRNLWDEEQV